MEKIKGHPYMIKRQPEDNGKNGHIYTGFDLLRKKTVAVKIFKSLDTAKYEYKIMKSYSKSSFLPICYDFFVLNKKPHLVMEFIDGHSLKKYLVKSGNLNEREAFKITTNIVKGLCDLHKQGIYHNDIHLKNVMIDKHNNIKIIDFGRASKKRGEMKDLYRAVYMSIKLITNDTSNDYIEDLAVASLPLENDLAKKIIEKGIHPSKDKRYRTATELLADLEKLRTSFNN